MTLLYYNRIFFSKLSPLCLFISSKSRTFANKKRRRQHAFDTKQLKRIELWTKQSNKSVRD